MQKMFPYQKPSENQKGSPTKLFGTVRQNFNGKSWYLLHPALFIPKSFRNRKFPETQHRLVPLRKVPVLKQKNFDGKPWCSLASSPHPLLPKLFPYRKFSETRNGFSSKCFSTARKKSTENGVTAPSLPSLSSVKFFDIRKILEHRKVPLRRFSALWDKTFSTEDLDTPLPLLCINFFANSNFLEHSTEGFHYELFRYCETTKIRRKILILSPPPLIHKLFRYRNFSQTQHRSVPLRCLGIETTKFRRDIMMHARLQPSPLHPLLPINFFATGKTLKHGRVPLKNVSVLRQKKLTENGATGLLSVIHKNFWH